MRQIKFRACDPNTKTMFGVWKVNCEYNGIAIPEKLLNLDFDKTIKKEEMILMQFTGLLDKNGTEIYEGDIVRVKERRWSEYKNEFEYLDEYIADIRFIDCSFYPYSKNSEMFLWQGEDNIIEVIGNIYEHPDLITKTNTDD